MVPGLHGDVFREWVAVPINQTLLVRLLINCIKKNDQVSEADMRLQLTEIGVDKNAFELCDNLEVYENPLTYFLPTQYELARDLVKQLIQSRPPRRHQSLSRLIQSCL